MRGRRDEYAPTLKRSTGAVLFILVFEARAGIQLMNTDENACELDYVLNES